MRIPSKSWWRLRLHLRPWAEDALVNFLVEHGIPGVETLECDGGPVIVAYAPRGESPESWVGKLEGYAKALEEIQGPPFLKPPEVEAIRGEEWAEAWKAHFHPASVSPRFVVKPTWESYDPPEGVWVLEIDPGQAFGTGLHDTTRMCLRWLDEMAGETGAGIPSSALDVGTGTGILAIAMARVGVPEVWALDDDPLATQAARLNVEINEVGERVRVLDGSLSRVAGRSFPMVMANLTGGALLGLRSPLCAIVAPGGRFVVSGILLEERASVKGAFEESGLGCEGIRESGEWCSMLLTRER
jgi:ribosomal protein L11 methyltransferase